MELTVKDIQKAHEEKKMITVIGDFISTECQRHPDVRTFHFVKTGLGNIMVCPCCTKIDEHGVVLFDFKYPQGGMSSREWNWLFEDIVEKLSL